MNRNPWITLALVLLVEPLAACSFDHGHAHAEGGHAHGDHGHGDHGHPHPTPASAATKESTDETAPAVAGVDLMLGSWNGTLVAGATSLRLVVKGSDGAPVEPSGEAKVILTGVGEDEQRITLTPGDGGWVGDAKAEGAPGYVAVVGVTLDGHRESGRATWGEIPEPAEPAHHGHGNGNGGHDHGSHGHAH